MSRLVRSVALSLSANDGPVDDFLKLVSEWEEMTGTSLIGEPEANSDSSVDSRSEAERPRQGRAALDEMLGSIAAEFTPMRMRELGSSLTKLADALDQNWSPDMVRSSFHWATQAGQIERRALELAKVAIHMRELGKRRARHVSQEFIGEPAWEMLLELFIQFAGGAKVSTKSLCLVSGASDTTALRLIDRMEDSCLLERSQSPVDRRVTLVRLTHQGIIAVGSILAEFDR